MAGIVGQYNSMPRIKNMATTKIIQPSGGTNPVDTGAVSLPNVRGQVTYTIIVDGDPIGASISFSMIGGFGEFPSDWSKNWHFKGQSNINCSVAKINTNIYEVTGDLGLFPGPPTNKVYQFIFSRAQSFSPTIEQTTLNLVGNNNLNVSMSKSLVIEGW